MNLSPRLNPLLNDLKRGPQVVIPKDIGMIISYTGIGKDSICFDAGTGAGFVAISLANICKNTVSYENDTERYKLALENVKRSGFDNIEVKNKDVFDGIDETNLDLVVLDLPNAEKAVPSVRKALKKGKFLVGYLPNAEQTQLFAKKCKEEDFEEVFCLESIVREYLTKETGFRPKNVGLVHTAYLVFARK